ncbi:MAG: DMT family transporter [Thermoprotei archaeon]|nr:DMT family transporter [Thermoprotei archaeon]
MWGGFFIVGAAVLWSTIGVASVYGGDVVILAFVRSIIAGFVGLLFVRFFSRASIVAGFFLGLLFSSYPLAAVLAGVGVAAYLLYTAPLWASMASLVYGERLGVYSGVSVVLVLLAVVFMGVDVGFGGLSFWGFVSGLLAGVSYGLYIAVARYYSRVGRSLEVSLGAMPYTLMVTAPLTVVYALTSKNVGDLYSPVAAGVYLAVFATLIPYRLFTKGVERVGAATASVIATLEPVLAAIWGFLLFKEIPTFLKLATYILITMALIIAALGDLRVKRRGGNV